jgi:hypothetical protein
MRLPAQGTDTRHETTSEMNQKKKKTAQVFNFSRTFKFLKNVGAQWIAHRLIRAQSQHQVLTIKRGHISRHEHNLQGFHRESEFTRLTGSAVSQKTNQPSLQEAIF